MTLEQQRALAIASARLRVQQQGGGGPPPPAEQESPLLTMGKRALGGAVEPNLALLSGAVAAPVAGLVGLGSAATKGLGLTSADPGDVTRAVQSGMTYEPRSEGGKTAMEALSYPFQKLGEAADYTGGAVTDLTGSAGAGAVVNALMQTAPALAGARFKTPTTIASAAESGVQGVKGAMGDVANLVRESGPTNIVKAGVNKLVGSANTQAVREALLEAQETVPGSRPTAAEALVGIPEGSPIATYQRTVAQTPGGPSAEFGARLGEQTAAREAALAKRDALTDPMREEILSRTGNIPVGGRALPVLRGYEPSGSLMESITGMLNAPGNKANVPLQRAVTAVKEQIEANAKTGEISPQDLYTVRKNLGNTIEEAQRGGVKWDKEFTAKIAADLQKVIDEAIVQAGGRGWKEYLGEYSKRSRAVEEDAARTEEMYKPAQKTSAAGDISASEGTKHLLPNLLAKPITGTKWLMERISEHVQPKVDAVATEMLLQPEKLAQMLNSASVPERSAIISALLKRSTPYAGTAAMTSGAGAQR